MHSLRRWALTALIPLTLAACSGAQDTADVGDLTVRNSATDASAPPVFFADDNPEQLSAWNLIHIADNQLTLGEGVTPYDLNTALFTDYAHKLRTVWLPDGQAARYDARETFDFPVGTVLSKTFYYPLPEGAAANGNRVLQSTDDTAQRLNAEFDLAQVRLVETRLLVRRADGWDALPYVWNAEQDEAVLKRTGAMEPLVMVGTDGVEQEFAYVVPNANQCAGCHATNATTREVHPIGPRARHLNRPYDYAEGQANQIAHWQDAGLLSGAPTDVSAVPQNAAWGDATAPLDHRARSYLDINCSHCHNSHGPADTSGLLLEPDTPFGTAVGKCKLPIAAGKGTGNRAYGIVPGHPEESIFTYRMQSTNPAEMMPELGRSLSHKEGSALIADWIAAMPGSCD